MWLKLGSAASRPAIPTSGPAEARRFSAADVPALVNPPRSDKGISLCRLRHSGPGGAGQGERLFGADESRTDVVAAIVTLQKHGDHVVVTQLVFLDRQ